MLDFLDLMLKPFLVCVILTGIHAYLGLHVIKRGVIFVDLALAQVAALGATCGYLLGYHLHSTHSYFISLTFALIGAAIFAITRFRKPLVPHEAIIGIIYAVSASAAIIVLSKTAEGGEELKSLLVGHLLFVDWNEILKVFILYSIVGTIHFFARKPLLLISQNPEASFQQGLNVRLWDFLFYGTFGVVITSSVEIAGVLLVFSFLVVPAVCAALLSEKTTTRLVLGWFLGTLTSVCGVYFSYFLDLPTGATVVCTFGFCFLICALLRIFKRVEHSL